MATKFLASVRNRAEALTALDNGADIIDVKEPDAGALGAADTQSLADILAAVAGRKPVSAVAGTLSMAPESLASAVAARRHADFVKVGLSTPDAVQLGNALERLAAHAGATRLIAVLFADEGVDPGLLDRIAAAGFAGVMLDTARKDGRRLIDHAPLSTLSAFVDAARRLDLFCGLAGALEAPDVPRLLPLRADYLGFRGALTDGGRGDGISAARVAGIAALVHPQAGPVAPGPVDRVFIRDFVHDMEIGAYGFERGRRQRVRFSIEAEVPRRAAGGGGMADIYSYDLMMDAVRAIVARGHIDLVETIAEELAATILADSRVTGVTVRVEKLDLGPAAAGIEIRREAGDSCCGAASN
ncbi:dihydroneopterin aldolase [Aureimonas altamirensis DSM 21988]|uniref:4-(hydroxymethyl)-2-furancarboxaldehyde-phosphate synthase n=1 Tax=Aureimonas altamirensis DSM 21988 TaxID=1121026 RepID=A0ABY1IFV8_9HYPH|nr:(5-formylfuran-3-yl)methyl phosphate synthase [Aureimonas altamirensis]SHJ11435.1 dihydroneopterin aldolase [Aureimonas altamirensis DSM 21988]